LRLISRFFLGLLVLLIFNLSFPSSALTNNENAGTIQSVYSVAPTIDGVLDDSVWSAASKQTFILYDILNQSNTVEIDISSLFSNNDTLYLGLEVEEEWASAGRIFIIFQSNKSDNILVGVDPEIIWGQGHDAKYIRYNDIIYDGFMTNDFVIDEDNGGTTDFQGQASGSGYSYSYELEIPFNSGDTLGFDLNITIDDELKFFLIYYSGADYSQIRPDDAEWDHCTLEFIFPTPSKSLAFVNSFTLLFLFGLSITVILVKRK